MRSLAGASALLLGVTLAPSPASAAAGAMFAAAEYLNTGSTHTTAVEIADVTADGRPDLLVATGAADNEHTSALLVFAQRADGGYGEPVRIAGHGSYGWDTQLEIADMDGDGRIDAVMSTNEGVDVFYQRLGTLTPPVLIGPRARDVAIADLNADRRRDLVVSALDGALHVHLQSPSGDLTAYTEVTGPSRGGSAEEQVFAVDLTGDRRADLVQAHALGAWMRVQRPDGTFAGAVIYQQAPAANGTMWSSCASGVGDVTGDGRPDLVIQAGGNGSTAATNVFVQRAAGGLDPVPAVYPAYDIPCVTAIADLDGDGRKDLITGHSGWLAVSVRHQLPDGTLGAYTTFPIVGFNRELDGLAIGDVDGDGKPDIVGAVYQRIAILRQR